MTVLERTPDHVRRPVPVRRAAFLATAFALLAAFGVTLSGIASTQGTLRPDGQAAAVAARQIRSSAAPSHDCPFHQDRPRVRTGSGRV